MAWTRSTSSSTSSSPPEKPVEFAALIDEGAELDGTLSFSGTVRLNCRVRGELLSSGVLIIGDKAVIHATVRSRILRIEGEVNGDVYASERIELQPTARVHGDIEAPAVVLAEGAFFQGQVRMQSGPAAEPAPLPVRSRDFTVVPLKRSEMPR